MSKRLYLYALWCLMMIVAAVLMSYFAWSPFADGVRGSSYYYGGSHGPTHK